MTLKIRRALIASLAVAGLLSFAPTAPAQSPAAAEPTVAEALAFLDSAEKELNAIGIDVARAQWVEETFITDDTVALLAQANDRLIARPNRSHRRGAPL